MQRLPIPAGPHSVGRSTVASGGESVLLFYPAKNTGKAAAYAPAKLIAETENSGYYMQSPQTIRSWSSVETHSTADAVPLSGTFPLVVFLPGQGIYGFQYTVLAEDLASRGYVVAVLDYYSPKAPKRSYAETDAAAENDSMARAAVAVRKTLLDDPGWSKHISFLAAAAGHSIGGAAAIAVPRLDRNFRAVIDFDGAPFGISEQGSVVPTLVLRSKPIYSEADLAKRGRTREEWDKMGQNARKIWSQFLDRSPGVVVRVLSVTGTAHLSFSDAPFVMPETITHFGGTFATAARTHAIVSTCTAEILNAYLRNDSASRAGKECADFPEVTSSR